MLHATLVAAWADGRWRGVLLRGPSGSGKSALALRLVADGWRLVADDRVIVWRSGDAAWGCPPAALAGLIEARGAGIATLSTLSRCSMRLVADLLQLGEEGGERVPGPAFADVAGVRLPRHSLAADSPAASLRLRLALSGGFDSAAMGRI